MDPHPGVRAGAAKNRWTLPEALACLARDPDPDVRRAVAGNDNSGPGVVSALADDPDEAVRGRGGWQRSHPSGGAGWDRLRWWVSLNPSTPSDVLVALADDTHPGTQQGVAANQTTPAAVFCGLTRHPGP